MISNFNLSEGVFHGKKMVPNLARFWRKHFSKTSNFYDKFYWVAKNMEGPPFSFLFKTFIFGNVGEFGSFFGDDGHFGDITKLAIKDKTKKKEKTTTT
jgi:hypothetical protein